MTERIKSVSHFQEIKVYSQLTDTILKMPDPKDEKAAKNRLYHEQLWITALKIYGWKCVLCGNGDIRFFEWHHNKGNHTREKTARVLKRIRDAGEMLPEIELACKNCHSILDRRDKTGVRNRVTMRLYTKFLRGELKP